jgi:carbon starvation protein
MALLGLGVLVAHPTFVAPAINTSPTGAPPMWPMLFVIVACGAISGFHSLVSSGTSSKQCDNEESSLTIGYGGMLTEGMLATFALIACGAGLAIGLADKSGTVLTGVAAYNMQYGTWGATQGLGSQLNAVVTGSANLIDSLGIPHTVTITIMGVFVASFAATTLDTATRLQRYVVSEIAEAVNVPFATKKHPATVIAVGTALLLAFSVGASGTGALTLWPLFGATNQLLAGLALLVITIFLARRKISIVFTGIPMLFMLVMTGWAMQSNLVSYYEGNKWLLFCIGSVVVILEIWMIIESLIILSKVYTGKITEATAG